MLLTITGVIPGKMFGYPAFYFHNKLFACLYEEGVGIKVPKDLADDLIGKEGIIPFQPMGRAKMKEWIQINRTSSEEYLQDMSVFEASMRFILSLEKS